jgi:hypothetical protein
LIFPFCSEEISDGFVKAVETIRNLGFPMSITAIPFGDPTDGISNIEADRKAISKEAFEEIDMLLLPTTSPPFLRSKMQAPTRKHSRPKILPSPITTGYQL